MSGAEEEGTDGAACEDVIIESPRIVVLLAV
jgi:hypothetical protein